MVNFWFWLKVISLAALMLVLMFMLGQPGGI